MLLLRGKLNKPAPGVSSTDVRKVAETAVAPLERRIESLELACAGMWELIKSKFELTDEELMAVIERLDTRDAKFDAEITEEVEEKCPSCGRGVVAKRTAKCLWCGADLPRGPFQL